MPDELVEKFLKLSQKELVEELKKLHPQRRIRILREIEEIREEEKKETDRLKRASIEEINIESVLESNDGPVEEEVDINKIFGAEQENLESQINSEKIPEGEFDNSQYQTRSQAVEYMANLYNEVRELVNNQSNNQGYNIQTQSNAQEIYDRFFETYKHKFSDEQAKDLADGMRSLMKQLKGDYMSQVEGYNVR